MYWGFPHQNVLDILDSVQHQCSRIEVALRLVLGQWPWQNQSDIREVTRDLTRQLSGGVDLSL